MDEQPDAVAGPATCPLCGNRSFDQEEGRLDSKWGVTAHRVLLRICRRCRFVLTF